MTQRRVSFPYASDRRVRFAELLDDLRNDGLETILLFIEAVLRDLPTRVMIKTPTR